MTRSDRQGDDPTRAATEQALREAMTRSVRTVGDVPDLVERMHARAGTIRRQRRMGAVAGAVTVVVAVTGLVVRSPWGGSPGDDATVSPATGPSAPAGPSTAPPAPTIRSTTTQGARPSGTARVTVPGSAGAARNGAAAATGAPAGPWGAAEVDDGFAGSALDLGRWSPYDGASGSPETVWSPDQVSVAGGALRLTVARASTSTPAARAGGVKLSASGERYGRWEVRLRMTAGHGVTGQFLLLGEGPGGIGHIATLEPAERRIVIEDLVRGTSRTLALDGTAYHLLALESTPDGVRWLIDGREVVAEPGAAPRLPVVPALQALIQASDCGRTPLPADCAGPVTLPQHLDVDRFRYFPYEG